MALLASLVSADRSISSPKQHHTEYHRAHSEQERRDRRRGRINGEPDLVEESHWNRGDLGAGKKRGNNILVPRTEERKDEPEEDARRDQRRSHSAKRCHRTRAQSSRC